MFTHLFRLSELELSKSILPLAPCFTLFLTIKPYLTILLRRFLHLSKFYSNVSDLKLGYLIDLITLKFQIEHTARKKLTRLKKSTNHLARDTKIGHDIEAIDI